MTLTEQQQQEQEHYYDSLYHLAEVSAYKLNNSRNTEQALRRQLFIRNVLVLSSNLILSEQNTQEEVWLNACFDELMDEEEEQEGQDTLMEEQQVNEEKDNKKKDNNLVVMAFPFDYSADDQTIRKGTLFLL